MDMDLSVKICMAIFVYNVSDYIIRTAFSAATLENRGVLVQQAPLLPDGTIGDFLLRHTHICVRRIIQLIIVIIKQPLLPEL